MKKKPKVSKSIRGAANSLAEICHDKLAVIADDLVQQVMGRSKRLIPSQKLKALSGLAPRGVMDYKDAVKTALSVMALDALDQARKEVPTKKNVQLCEHLDSLQIHFAEFDRLPPALQRKITTQTQLLVGKQIGDLQKVIEFGYTTAEEETDSEDQIQADLNDSAVGWLDGTAVQAGAELTSATIINSARSAFFFDDEVLEEVEAFEFVNGDPVTEICQDLAGTIFAKDDPAADRFFPPLHWNCKSYIQPILVGNLKNREIESLAPSKKSLEDQVQFHELHDPMCKHND